MTLSGRAILKAVEAGDIVIEPLNRQHVGANSVDLTLANKLVVYDFDTMFGLPHRELDMKVKPRTRMVEIPRDGLVLEPGKLYLAMTNEIAGTRRGYVPCIEGRSSVARLGLFVHITAGFGDVGFVNRWTLEMVATHPIRIYAGVRICQVYFSPVVELADEHGRSTETEDPILYGGKNGPKAGGKYATITDLPQPSRIHLDFEAEQRNPRALERSIHEQEDAAGLAMIESAMGGPGMVHDD